MENKLINATDLSLFYDGRKVCFGNVYEDKKLFVLLDKTSGYYFSEDQYNKPLTNGQSQILSLNYMYSINEPAENRIEVRSSLDSLEDTVLYCIYKKGNINYYDLKKVEVFLTKSISSRFTQEEANKMFEESIVNILEKPAEME